MASRLLLCVLASPWIAVVVLGQELEDLPVLSLDVAPKGTWPAPNRSFFHGDVRAVLQVTSTHLASRGNAAQVQAQIYWRRRDSAPASKHILVTDSKHNEMPVKVTAVEGTCGILSFVPGGGPGTYYVYYLAFFQSGTTYPGFHFSWFNGTWAGSLGGSHAQRSSAPSLWCSKVIPSAASLVQRLENRDTFHGFARVELMAAPSEIKAMTLRRIRARGVNGHVQEASSSPPVVVMARLESALRSFGVDQVPVQWALLPRGERLSLNASTECGQSFAFQIGLYAVSADTGAPLAVDGVSVSFSPLTSSAGVVVPSSAFSCLNTGGIDYQGNAFTKNYSLAPSTLGSLWVTVQLPSNTTVTGNLSSCIKLLTLSEGVWSATVMSLHLDVKLPVSGKPVPYQGDENVYSFSRLRWLNSQRGIAPSVTAPFAPVTVASAADAGLELTCLDKTMWINSQGLPQQAVATHRTKRRGRPQATSYALLQDAVTFELYSVSGKALSLRSVRNSTISSKSSTSVSWTAAQDYMSSASAATVRAGVRGSLDFDGWLSFSVNLTASQDIDLGNIMLRVPVNKSDSILRYTLGMGAEGSPYHDREWRWDTTKGDFMAWLGRTEAGVFVKPKGNTDVWNTPLPSGDSGAIPYIPKTWGGVDAGKPVSTVSGCNITQGEVTCYCGPRSLRAGSSLVFMFDMLFTPAKPVDHAAHWHERYVQVGYGQLSEYMSPKAVRALNATVVTLHQGVRGIVNNTLVNPYINYPFLPQTVSLLANYTEQANALGMRVKYYYTIRELSNHAAELFALLSLQGEVIRDGLGTKSPGYCHDWDCLGGGAFLQQHIQAHYAQCWQQSLSNGVKLSCCCCTGVVRFTHSNTRVLPGGVTQEWDEAVCDLGTSRWFNYYIEGLHWAVSQSPHIDGIYYDGINFDRHSMARVRRVVDAATENTVEPLLDLHTGHQADAPPACLYLSHYAYVNSVWNGEGFDFTKGPAYWLVEVSGQPQGLTGDRLGGSAPTDDFRGMLFGMTQRNSATAPKLWTFWDRTNISATTPIGFWEDDRPVHLAYECDHAVPPYNLQVLTTVYTAWQSHAVVALASWCLSAVNVTLQVNWEDLGLNATSTVVSVLEVPGVQAAVPKVDLSKPYALAPQSGVLLYLKAV